MATNYLTLAGTFMEAFLFDLKYRFRCQLFFRLWIH